MRKFIFEIKSRIGVNFLQSFFSFLKLNLDKKKHKDFISKTNNTKIDVVIPTTDKDFELLSLVIDSLKNIGNKVNNIYIVAPAKESVINFCKTKNIIFFDEIKVLGFGKNSLEDYTVNGVDRRGWLFQQFLKYEMRNFVEQENYLVLDSDTILINTNTFLEDNKFVFFKATWWHEPYVNIFKKIFGYEMKNFTSFTSHMMIFNKLYLSKMLTEIESRNKNKWYNVIQKNIDKNEMSSISDYENYGQWMFINYRSLIKEKPLYNESLNRKLLSDLDSLQKLYKDKYNTVSFHDYIQ